MGSNRFARPADIAGRATKAVDCSVWLGKRLWKEMQGTTVAFRYNSADM